ncbi:MAG: ATP-binding protein [Acidimicrobiales bacterium]|nr:ATP-binding protein [Acidimicrobiales bacterium]
MALQYLRYRCVGRGQHPDVANEQCFLPGVSESCGGTLDPADFNASQGPTIPIDRPTLVLFCGPPGSGKTTLAKRLESAGRGIRMCTDDWQEALCVSHADEEFHSRLQARLYEHALALLEHGQDVILEDGLWMKHERDQKMADARRCGARTEIHVFDLDFDELWARLDRRNRSRPEGAVPMERTDLEHILSLFQLPDAAELRRFDAYELHRADSEALESNS